MQGANLALFCNKIIRENLAMKVNFKSIERRIKAIVTGVEHLQKRNIPTYQSKDKFISQRHREIANMILQAEKDIILASRQGHFKNMSKYLKLLQPAMLDNLTRIGGCGESR